MDNTLFWKVVILLKEENRSSWCADLHAVFLAVIKELNSWEEALCLGFHWLMNNAQQPGQNSVRAVMETWPANRMLLQDCPTEIWGCMKVGHINAFHKNSLLGLEGDSNYQADFPACPFEMVTWVHE